MYIWTPSDVVTIIAALSAFVVSIINALHNTQTQTQSQANQDRINALTQHVQNHDQQLTTLALSIPSSSMPSIPPTPAVATGLAASPGMSSLVNPSTPAPSSPLDLAGLDLVAPQGEDMDKPQ